MCVCVVSVRVLDGVGLDCGVRVRSMCVLVGFGGVSWCVQSVCVVSVSVYVSIYVSVHVSVSVSVSVSVYVVTSASVGFGVCVCAWCRCLSRRKTAWPRRTQQ